MAPFFSPPKNSRKINTKIEICNILQRTAEHKKSLLYCKFHSVYAQRFPH